MKRFINLYVPVKQCNLKCSYCYITQSGLWKSELPSFKYTKEEIREALSQKRLGGVCHINICGGGETLLPVELIGIVEALLQEGHYIMIVTNGTLSKRFDEYLKFDKTLLKRLGFKFSLHYLQLIENQRLMEAFLSNVRKCKDSGCSFSIEMTPHDELIPYISQIKKFCMDNFGALCHLTVARNTTNDEIPILTNLSKKDYIKTWSVFDSKLFDFKMSTFNVKRTEFCYAGDWSLWVNLGDGTTTQCYSSGFKQNIFKSPEKPIQFCAVGKECTVPHCHNSHALLTMGVIPEINAFNYAEMRDRLTEAGEHWLNEDMRNFLSGRLQDENNEYSRTQKVLNYMKKRKLRFIYLFKRLKNRKGD